MELLFLFGFSLHNIEEGIWLPNWSKHAKKFHKEVDKNEFRFSLIIITSIGILITFLEKCFGNSVIIIEYIYCGFIGMMILNVLFPHVIATIILRKYAPGTITGIMLNFPIGMTLLVQKIASGYSIFIIIVATVIISCIIIGLLNLLFKLGKKLIAY
jgi:hypothetical protein